MSKHNVLRNTRSMHFSNPLFVQEFQDLHERLNETLALKGPITRNDVKNLLASVKEVQNLAVRVSSRQCVFCDLVDVV